MRNLSTSLKNRIINYDKLLDNGFLKEKNKYLFEKSINNDEFKVIIEITKEKQISKVIDQNTNDEYILIDTKTTGSFVGKIKDEYEKIIKNFIEKCTIPNIFKSKNSKHVIKYIKNKYNDDLEYLWEKLPNCAIWRNKDNNKWYGLIMTIKESSLGLKSDNETEVLNLKYQKDQTDEIINNKTIYPAYHMNKSSWISIKLDEDINITEIENLIDNSYNLLINKNRTHKK